MPIPTDDLGFLYKDSGGVLARFGSKEAWGHFDKADKIMVEQMTGVRGVEYQFVCAYNALSDVEIDDEITIAGTDYAVRSLMRTDSDNHTFLLAIA